MGPFLYLIYTFDLSLAINILVGTFTDDADKATVLATHEDPTIASKSLQQSPNEIFVWLRDWLFKTDEYKSAHITTSHSDMSPL